MDDFYKSGDNMEDADSDISMEDSLTSPASDVFRLMDLPPEIREQIYHYIFLGPSNTYIRKLPRFKLPAITRSSPQVRHESLPLFFATCEFEILTGANLLELSRTRRLTKQQKSASPLAQEERRCGGTLGISSMMTCDLKRLGAAVVFKHLKFILCETDDIRRLRQGSPSDEFRESHICGSISITASAKGFEWKFAPGGGYHGASRPKLRDQEHYFESEDVDRAVQRLVKSAREIAGRKAFIGFTIRDLLVVVGCLWTSE